MSVNITSFAANSSQPFEDITNKNMETALLEITIMLVGSYMLGLLTYWLVHRFAHGHTRQRSKPPKTAVGSKRSGGDDFTQLEGIGPRINAILHSAGVETYADLAKMSRTEVKEILDSAGPRYQMFEPSSWIEQAKLAAEGKSEELEALKRQLMAGR